MNAQGRSLLLAAATLALVAGAPAPLDAQSDILMRLRSGSPLGDRMRVDSAGGFVALGTLGVGIIPTSGQPNPNGVRMMWYPVKGSFRAGSPGDIDPTSWDDAKTGFYSWAGGHGSQSMGFATVAIGDRAVASGSTATAFGLQTVASGASSTALGSSTLTSGQYGLAAGFNSHCTSMGCAALGFRTSARGDYSFALGNRVSTGTFSGVFVWGDGITNVAAVKDSVIATGNNQFAIRASGGIRLFTNATTTSGVTMNGGGSTWNAVSDRHRKEMFAEVDGEDILARVQRVPVTSWNYIAEGREVRHIGPMAQDWHAAFGLNDDPLTINQGDFDGVNLAAIQALERRTAELLAERDALRERARALEGRVSDAEARLAALEESHRSLMALLEELARKDR